MVNRKDSHSEERDNIDRDGGEEALTIVEVSESSDAGATAPSRSFSVEERDYQWRFIIEFAQFDSLSQRQVDMLLATFEIKSADTDHVENLRQSTPYIRSLLPWDLILTTLRNAAQASTIRFGSLDPSLTRRDLERLHDRARDLAKLYAPIRFVVFEFESPLNETQLGAQLNAALSAGQLNAAQPVGGPGIRAAKLEARPANPPSGLPDKAAITQAQQAYLLSAADGIGARDVWQQLGGTGYGVQYVDIEYGWKLDHRDLPAIQAPYVGTYSYHLNSGAEQDHGTAMIGIISAAHNSLDAFGIAPEATGLVLSQLRASNLVNLPGAINQACATLLQPGDVLLIEAQTRRDGGPYVPVEYESEVFAAIEFGITLGITIIEPAGNSGRNLNKIPGFQIGDPNSGAVLVAGCDHDAKQTTVRWTNKGKGGSNFGARVDCFAWAGALGGLTNDSTVFYRVEEGGTSAAAAIIAGAAILVQSLYRAHFNDGTSIWPDEMRGYLTAPGNTQAPGHQIGIMPDLAKIYANLKPAIVPDKVTNVPQSLRRALFGTEASAQTDRSTLPRLATVGG